MDGIGKVRVRMLNLGWSFHFLQNELPRCLVGVRPDCKPTDRVILPFGTSGCLFSTGWKESTADLPPCAVTDGLSLPLPRVRAGIPGQVFSGSVCDSVAVTKAVEALVYPLHISLICCMAH